MSAEPKTMDAALARLQEHAADFEARRRRLVCFEAASNGEFDRAIDQCDAARAWPSCEFGTSYELCARMRQADFYDAVAQRLSAAAVPRSERSPNEPNANALAPADVILAAVRHRDRIPLRDLDSLRLVRAVLSRKRVRVHLDNAAEVHPDGSERTGEALLTGDESLVVLCGNRGRGKTVSACYAIARLGGLFTHAMDWCRPGLVDVERAAAVPVLVVDQYGREHESPFARAQLEDVLVKRHARRRLAFVVGNLSTRQEFDQRCGDVIADRVVGDGVVVLFGGESLRPELRVAALSPDTMGT